MHLMDVKVSRPVSRIPGFLISTTHFLLAFDGHDRFFRVHTGKGLYYGLAQDGHQIYISCRNQTQGPVDATARAEEIGSVLILDAVSLLPISEIRPVEFPYAMCTELPISTASYGLPALSTT